LRHNLARVGAVGGFPKAVLGAKGNRPGTGGVAIEDLCARVDSEKVGDQGEKDVGPEWRSLRRQNAIFRVKEIL
jgi:hypothetical protein